MLVAFLRTLILYIVIVFGVRLMGKRQLGDLQPSELVVTILISNIATLPIEEIETPLFAGLLPILSLVTFEVIISAINLHCRKIRRVFSGSPIVVIRNGEIDQKKLKELREQASQPQAVKHSLLPKKTIIFTIGILLVLIFTKYVYIASISSYYTFFLIEKFKVSVEHSQIFLFAFLFSSAMGTLLGGPLGDKFGRRYVIWFSILGAAPFALLMPHANLFWTCALSMGIGFIISSAFPAILVYGQELLPLKLGLVSGLFFGLAFGIAGIASAVLGKIADANGIEYVYNMCSFMPLLGMVAYFLPRVRTLQAASKTVYEK